MSLIKTLITLIIMMFASIVSIPIIIARVAYYLSNTVIDDLFSKKDDDQ